MSEECPTCERGDFESDFGVKQHHAKAHGESLSTVTLECDNCEENVEKKKYNIDESQKVYCNMQCKKEWMANNLKGENNYAWSEERVEAICEYCGEEELTTEGVRSQWVNWFCDIECRNSWMKNNTNGRDNPNWNGGKVEVECSQCGKAFLVVQGVYDRQEDHLCSKHCFKSWKSQEMIGNDYNGVADTKFRRFGVGWSRVQEKVVERDGNICGLCGYSDNSNRNLPVHHMVGRRYFIETNRSLSYVNKNWNCVQLCNACHAKVHCKALSFSVFYDIEDSVVKMIIDGETIKEVDLE